MFREIYALKLIECQYLKTVFANSECCPSLVESWMIRAIQFLILFNLILSTV